MSNDNKDKDYIKKRKKLSGIFFETALPNEYLVQIGKKNIKPELGEKKFKLFKKFIRIPASVQTLYFSTDNANQDFQGIGIEGYASWRIDPSRPEVAISTLDFFDEDNPTGKTNDELKTICVEAVRHVVANMNIDDALKKKDEITNNLKTQLKTIEEKWGIIFDQVGIKKVRIMSNNLFENLQAQFRDKLRLEVSKTKLDTDKKISSDEIAKEEEINKEKLESEKKINIIQLNNSTILKEQNLDEDKKLSDIKRKIDEEKYRKDLEFEIEKENKQKELENIKTKLQIQQNEIELKLLESEGLIQNLKNDIRKNKIEVSRIRRLVDQSFTSEEIFNRLIEILPEIYDKVNIDSYSIIDSTDGKGLSPVSRVLNEIMLLLKNQDLKGIIDNLKGKDKSKD